MAVIDALGGVTSQLVGVALDAALLRHEVIANNIANHSTPGYLAKRLSFEEQLAGYTDGIRGGNNAALGDRIDLLKEQLREGDALVVEDRHTVQLDREMVGLTENALRYQALLKAHGLRGDIMKLAVKEGRQ